MEFKKYGKTLFFGATLAVLAGCGGNAATQEQGAETATSDEQLPPVVTSDGSGSDSSIKGTQLEQDAQKLREQAEAAAAAIPQVDTLYFDFDQSTIRADSREVLDLHVAYLSANPQIIVVLEGHADERGTREYNNALGERRGNAVKSYLMVQGISGSRIEVVSYGEEQPAVIGHNNAAWAKNRRVKIKY